MEDNTDSDRMPENWETVPDTDEVSHPRDNYPIESEFTDGSERARADNGEYMSVAVAIVERYSGYNDLTAERVAEDFDISQQVAKEHLDHVREVYGPSDSEQARGIQEQLEQKRIRDRADQDLDNTDIY